MHLNDQHEDSYTLRTHARSGDLLFIVTSSRSYITIFLRTLLDRNYWDDKMFMLDEYRTWLYWSDVISGKIISKFDDAVHA